MVTPLLKRLGAWAAGLDYRQIPPEILRAARYQVLNMVAAVHAAAHGSEIGSIAPAIRDLSPGAGRATMLADGQKLGPAHAALANCAYSMAQDYDDIVWMGHTGHSAVFASLAVAETERRSTEELITAVVVANEIGGRLGASSLLGPLNGQMWSFIHLVSAAAAAAKLLGLDAQRTTHALAISLAQPNFALQPGFFKPSSKLLTASTPTATGIQAAYFARHGMTGEASIVEDRRGFWSRFSFLPLPFMMGDLGTFWVTGSLGVKTFPGCYYFQTTCSAIERLLARRPALAVEAVESIVLHTTKLGMEATRFASEYVAPNEITPVNVNFDLALSAAVFFHARRLGSCEIEAGWLDRNAPALQRWRDRITVEHDVRMTLKVIRSAMAIPAGRDALKTIRASDVMRLIQRYRAEYRSSLVTPRELLGWVGAIRAGAHHQRFSGLAEQPPAHAVPLVFPGRVTVRLKDGSVDREELDLPPGSLAAPGIEQTVRRKFLTECAPSLGEPRALAALEAGLALETRGLADFVELCTVG